MMAEHCTFCFLNFQRTNHKRNTSDSRNPKAFVYFLWTRRGQILLSSSRKSLSIFAYVSKAFSVIFKLSWFADRGRFHSTRNYGFIF